MRGLDSARIGLQGARESAARISEKLSLEQRLRNGCAVDDGKGPGGARAQVVQGARDQFLAAARRSRNQNGRVARRNQPHLPVDRLHRCASARSCPAGRPRHVIAIGMLVSLSQKRSLSLIILGALDIFHVLVPSGTTVDCGRGTRCEGRRHIVFVVDEAPLRPPGSAAAPSERSSSASRSGKRRSRNNSARDRFQDEAGLLRRPWPVRRGGRAKRDSQELADEPHCWDWPPGHGPHGLGGIGRVVMPTIQIEADKNAIRRTLEESREGNYGVPSAAIFALHEWRGVVLRQFLPRGQRRFAAGIRERSPIEVTFPRTPARRFRP